MGATFYINGIPVDNLDYGYLSSYYPPRMRTRQALSDIEDVEYEDLDDEQTDYEYENEQPD